MIYMKVRRAYVMRERAAAAGATRRRVLESAAAAVWNRRASEVRLEEVAASAGVTVQTVLRLHGTRARLLDAAWEVVGARIRAQREAPAPGDVRGTVRALFDHYEEMGDFVIRNLADEARSPEAREFLAHGRAAHRRSMRRQFAPWLAARTARARGELVDCLVAACDVYVWKLLRRDLRLPREAAEARVRRIVAALLEEGRG
jgi:AcrR family transcriptional regulator